MYKRRGCSQQGFTLIELMISVAVIALAFVGILGTNILIQQGSEGSFERTVAIQDANQVIERMRNAANQASSTNFQSDVTSAATAAISAVGSLPGSHNETITVTYEDTSANPLDVTVTVTWQERGLRTTSTSIRTLITRRAS